MNAAADKDRMSLNNTTLNNAVKTSKTNSNVPMTSKMSNKSQSMSGCYNGDYAAQIDQTLTLNSQREKHFARMPQAH